MSVKLVYDRPEIHAPFSAVKSIVVELEDERSLDEYLDAYKEFLLCMGFHIDGHLDVVSEDDLTD